ncbi:hypothetical protein QBC34DRAFT_418444 [Podospora aff. communis PSN243]|uniref:DUF6594 domain-containing protein n=1 Tax=Podospora aff. communis PSN243 TaxID=3040156 RepID=A0AAV9G0X2_9PEZI|nr:hypothetical protein QBC34DRAFT_418444 [Podospora aff. communis PSN243]
MPRQLSDEESGSVRSSLSGRSNLSSPPPSTHPNRSIQAAASRDDTPATGTRHITFEPTQPRQREDDLDIDNPDKWVWNTYGQYLVTKVTPWAFNRKDGGKTSFEVNLAEVQRMYLVQLRIKLAHHISRWEKSGGGLTGSLSSKGKIDANEGSWEEDLHRYVQGLQDYDYMDKCSQTSRIDPFRMSGESKLDRIILDTSLGNLNAEERGLTMKTRDVRRWDKNMRAIIPSRTDNRYKRLFSRVVVSAVGAGFLIGPMWLMMLKTGLYVALISTSAFVAVFGVMMACVLDEHIHVLSSTAAYAAVLVVFVGLRGEASGEAPTP